MVPLDLHFGSWRGLGNAKIERIINWVWHGQTSGYAEHIIKYVEEAKNRLKELTANRCEF